MKTLVGSEKQIRWAESFRQQIVDGAEEMFASAIEAGDSSEQIAALRNILWEKVLEQKEARFFIDMKYRIGNRIDVGFLLRDLVKDLAE